MIPVKPIAVSVLMAVGAATSGAELPLIPSPRESRVPGNAPPEAVPVPAPGASVNAPAPGIDPFVPSETISADASVSFPVDI